MSSSAWLIRPEADRGGSWWFGGGFEPKSTTRFFAILCFYFVLVVDVVDFAGKVPYEKNKKNESYREIFKTAKIHHNPPQKGGRPMKIDPNPCLGHGCYDTDLGCTIPASEHWYACPLMPEPGPEDFEGLECCENARET